MSYHNKQQRASGLVSILRINIGLGLYTLRTCTYICIRSSGNWANDRSGIRGTRTHTSLSLGFFSINQACHGCKTPHGSLYTSRRQKRHRVWRASLYLYTIHVIGSTYFGLALIFSGPSQSPPGNNLAPLT